MVLLRSQRKVTFFTRDADLYMRGVCHRNYCLVITAVAQNEVAAFVRRFLKHPDFKTRTDRMGKVVRISHAGLVFWRQRSQHEIHTLWSYSIR